MRFDTPYWFLAAAVAAFGWMAIGLLRQTGNWVRPAILFSNLRPIAGQKPSWRLRARRLVVGINGLALLALIVAMTRPQSGRSDSVILSQGVDIMMVVDTSGSMAAQDFGGGKTRLWHAKEVMREFVKRRENDRIGLISFGAHAYTRCPMTLDYGLLDRFFQHVHDEWERAYESMNKKLALERNPRLTPHERDLQATAIGDAVVTATSRLQNSKTKSKIVILLTDGESNAGETEPIAAAEVAAIFGLKIYTIGAGSNERVPVKAFDAFGTPVTRFQVFPLDEKTLTEIAQKTGGRYFRASDRSELERVIDDIDRLEKSEVKIKDYREWDERFPPFAWLALGLLLLESLLAMTVLRTIP